MHPYFLRLICYLIIAGMWYSGFILFSTPLVFWYLLKFRAYELILLGFLIDVHFTIFPGVPYYTLGCLLLVVGVEWIKPTLSLTKNTL